MISKRMQEALNAQINAEYYSAYLYLAMAAHAEAINLKGFANWFRVQVQEEMVHVMKFFAYVLDRRGKVELKAIEAPPASWESPKEMFEATLKHEQNVTSRINNLLDSAREERDNATYSMLEWFITEQVEEEATAAEIADILGKIGASAGGLYQLDHRLGKRGGGDGD